MCSRLGLLMFDPPLRLPDQTGTTRPLTATRLWCVPNENVVSRLVLLPDWLSRIGPRLTRAPVIASVIELDVLTKMSLLNVPPPSMLVVRYVATRERAGSLRASYQVMTSVP